MKKVCVISIALILTAPPPMAREAKPERPIYKGFPEETRGFSGKVLGKVVEHGQGVLFEGTILFKVQKTTHEFKDSMAEKPLALAGKTIRVGPGQLRGRRGRRMGSKEIHMIFLRHLKPGMKLSLEVNNYNGNVFSLIGLSDDHRKWAQEKLREAMPERRENGERTDWRDWSRGGLGERGSGMGGRR